MKTLESAFGKAAQDKEFLALATESQRKGDPDAIRKSSSAVSKAIYNEIKGQEEKLKAMIKPEK